MASWDLYDQPQPVIRWSTHLRFLKVEKVPVGLIPWSVTASCTFVTASSFIHTMCAEDSQRLGSPSFGILYALLSHVPYMISRVCPGIGGVSFPACPLIRKSPTPHNSTTIVKSIGRIHCLALTAHNPVNLSVHPHQYRIGHHAAPHQCPQQPLPARRPCRLLRLHYPSNAGLHVPDQQNHS